MQSPYRRDSQRPPLSLLRISTQQGSRKWSSLDTELPGTILNVSLQKHERQSVRTLLAHGILLQQPK